MSASGIEQKWFDVFKMLLLPITEHAKSLGHTAVVMLYAAVEYIAAELREKAQITEDEVKHAREVAEAARKS